MLLNEDIVDIKKPDRICLLNFVVYEISELLIVLYQIFDID